MNFSSGFNKIANIDPLAMIGHSVESGKKTNADKAESHASNAAQAIKARKKHLAHYLLNPHVPGPLSELSSRLGRRHAASALEQPILAGVAGGAISAAVGGKKGLAKVEAAEKTASDNYMEMADKIRGHLNNHKARVNRQSRLSGLNKEQKLVGGAALAGLAGYTALNAATAGDKQSTESHKTKAETLGKYIKGQKSVREKNTAGYLLNPHAHGPIKELSARIARRHHASAAEHPYRTAIIPYYGAIRGGKAGEKDSK